MITFRYLASICKIMYQNLIYNAVKIKCITMNIFHNLFTSTKNTNNTYKKILIHINNNTYLHFDKS